VFWSKIDEHQARYIKIKTNVKTAMSVHHHVLVSWDPTNFPICLKHDFKICIWLTVSFPATGLDRPLGFQEVVVK
jgi:hypothetical protein